ncbi:filamentous hemagglutinin family N-terminal domain-containing protein [Verrucomicrobium sp. GAS474]|uniref:beta strand repeat-containing protein n=1 Tax=Verrucomicrobium sp. GAS474 TaxID=1882831 RepID=UPI00087B007E|nr:filamentous hemagglutinin N-terminal domain-containing protein [Verrucomicrobium sp. GAS474]SDU13592.1 filamentous hemagglutinin family N-terminal domain-containing protein [Verrucomicrobium sp. GAS474]
MISILTSVRSALGRFDCIEFAEELCTAVLLLFLTAFAWCLFVATAAANPTGADVVSGTASISSNGNTLNIVNSNGAIINWGSFSIGAGETTNFLQPSSASSVLNRVVGSNLSEIYGTLSSNGKVFLINPNGVMIGSTGIINTAGFLASTLDVSNADFLANNGSGTMHFTGNGGAGITNYGTIKALGGNVVLMAERVTNAGTISATATASGKGGNVVLGGGTDVYLTTTQNDGAYIRATGKGQIINSGTIDAVSARLQAAGGNEYALAINNTGTIKATGVVRRGGHVYLLSPDSTISNSGSIIAKKVDGSGGKILASGGTALNSGILDASASSGKGGKVTMQGNYVALYDGGSIYVSGPSGGGTVMIGGGAHGADPHVLNSQSTFIGSGSIINADATVRGNGGTVAVWSDGTTRFYGSISAKGAGAGLGGWVETSGHTLVAQGSVATGGGTWLLDPSDVVIGDAYSDSVSYADSTSYDFSTASDTSYISTGSLMAAMADNDVDVTASGSILVDGATASLTGGHTLNLTAQTGGITIQGSDLEGDYSLAAIAGDAVTITGSTINSSGTVRLSGTSVFSDSDLYVSALNLSGASVEVDGQITTTSGALSVTSTGPVLFQGVSATASSSGGTAISIAAGGPVEIDGEIDYTGKASISTTNADVTLNHDVIGDGDLSVSALGSIRVSNVTTSPGSVYLNAGTNVTIAGNVTSVASSAAHDVLNVVAGGDVVINLNKIVDVTGSVTIQAGDRLTIAGSSLIVEDGAPYGWISNLSISSPNGLDVASSSRATHIANNDPLGQVIVNVANGTLSITSSGSLVSGISAAGDLLLNAQQLMVRSGNVGAGGNATVNIAGDVTLTANGSAFPASISSGGLMDITAGGTISMGVWTGVSGDSGVSISSGSGFVWNSNISRWTSVTSSSGAVSVSSGSGFSGTNRLVINAGTNVRLSSGGEIDLANSSNGVSAFTAPTMAVGGESAIYLNATDYAAILPNGSQLLTVQVGDSSSTYGTVPDLSGVSITSTGLTAGDTLAALGIGGLTTTATASSPIGTYGITSNIASGTVIGNYLVYSLDGTLTLSAPLPTPPPVAPAILSTATIEVPRIPFQQEGIPLRLDRTDVGYEVIYANRPGSQEIASVNGNTVKVIYNDFRPAKGTLVGTHWTPSGRAVAKAQTPSVVGTPEHRFVVRNPDADEIVVGQGNYKISHGAVSPATEAEMPKMRMAETPTASVPIALPPFQPHGARGFEDDAQNPAKLVGGWW